MARKKSPPPISRETPAASGSETATKLKLALDHERLKQQQYETRKKQIALQECEGELLPRSAWEAFAADLLTGLATWCDQLPAAIAGAVPTKQRKALAAHVKKLIDQKRRELRDELERKAREIDQAAEAKP